MSASFAYLDSSAFVKLVIPEDESVALRQWLRDWSSRVASTLLRVEVIRSVMSSGALAIRSARNQMDLLHFIELNRTLLDSAAMLSQPVRSLDAIHLATALSLGADLGVVVTYS
ncbi:MAG: type II toxin-antitoxin system VapC family toxin [Candidatus Dormibacteraceae bacterium]